MGTISDYLEDQLLDHIFNAVYARVATVYLALGTSVDDTGLTGEPSGDGYAREACAFDAAASRKVQNSSLITFGPVSGSNWGTMNVWALYDQEAAGGNMLAHGDLDFAKDCNVGNTPKVAAAQVEVEFVADALSTAYAHELLNLAFRNVAGSGLPTTYIALCDETPVDADGDISAKEPTGNGYAREIVNENGGTSPTWDLAGGGTAPEVDNTHLVQFDTPSGSWGTITHAAVCDALTAGQVICWLTLDSSEAITTDDDVEFPVGDLNFNLV